MRTFAQKQNQPQKSVSSNLVRSRTATPMPHHRADLMQHAIGDQAVQRMLQTNSEELKAGLTGTASPLWWHDFSRTPIHPPAAEAIQTKLAVNQPGDEYEQEADRISEQVMRMPEPPRQRVCACGGGCLRCQTEQPVQEHEHLQTMRTGSSDLEQSAIPPIVYEALRSPGQPLDAATRGLMEPRFRYDFSHVRVHADARAADSTRVLGALAYTVGRDVVFGAGQYVPGTREGQKLMAHELTHVVQQSAVPGFNAAIPVNSGPGLERETNTVASGVTGSDKQPLEISSSTGIRLSSKPDKAATSQRPDKGQQGSAPVKPSMVEAEDVTRLLDELLNFWYFASRFGIENASLDGGDRAASSFLIALGGNLVWAATSFLNPAAAVAIRLMSVAGATVGSGTYAMLLSEGLPVDQCRERAKDMLGAIYAQFGNEKIDLTNQLLKEFEKWGLMDRNYAEHAEMRRSFAWQFMFDSKIPYNDPRALEKQAKGDVEAIWGKYLPCWRGFQLYELGQEYALHCYYEALVASGVADRAKGVKRYTAKVPEEIVRKTRLSGSVKHYEFPGGGSVEKYPYDVSGQFGEYLIHVPK